MPFNSQQLADVLLPQWQALRELEPEDRMRFLVQDFFNFPSQDEYERDLDVIRKCLERKS